MQPQFDLFPEAASTAAPRTDALYIFLCSVSAFFTLLIFVLIVVFAIRYRRRSAEPPPMIPTNYKLEATWIIIPFILTMVMFFWGARVYFFIHRPPEKSMELYVVGKQWMWKIQHPNGRREINSLHVPAGRPIRILLASQDVIHSFFIPAFRIKQDALPGRYTVIWFEPTRLGRYHLFCAEYCGTHHADMIGTVTVMEPERYQAWLSGVPVEETPAQAGEKLFSKHQCGNCHGIQAPTLAGLYGREVRLADGSTIVADEHYLRESILDAPAKVVAGYPPVMPSYRGQLTEEEILRLIAFIKSLKNPELLEKAD